MKFYVGIFTLYLHVVIVSTQNIRHSSAGEYYVEWREIGPCPPEKRGTNEIFTDVRINRKRHIKEVIGNVTFVIPHDDTMPLKMDFAILSSNLAWLPNAYTITFPRGCSDGLIGTLGEGWINFMKSFNISPKCPVPKGFYRTKGYDTENFLKNSKLPKQFFYGRYKVSMEYLNKYNVLIGCTQLVIDVLPLWQKPRKQKEPKEG